MNVCVPSCEPVPSGHEDHLIPYSVVQPVQIQTKRPVIFSPSLFSRGLIERLLQPAGSALKFDTCQPGKCPPGTHFITHMILHTPANKQVIVQFTTTWCTTVCFLCFAEPIPASGRREKTVFLLEPCGPEQALGIRLQSIQDVISQVMKKSHIKTYFVTYNCLCSWQRTNISDFLEESVYGWSQKPITVVTCIICLCYSVRTCSCL